MSRRLQIFFKPTSEMPYSFASVWTGWDHTLSYSSLRVSLIGSDAIAEMPPAYHRCRARERSAGAKVLHGRRDASSAPVPDSEQIRCLGGLNEPKGKQDDQADTITRTGSQPAATTQSFVAPRFSDIAAESFTLLMPG